MIEPSTFFDLPTPYSPLPTPNFPFTSPFSIQTEEAAPAPAASRMDSLSIHTTPESDPALRQFLESSAGMRVPSSGGVFARSQRMESVKRSVSASGLRSFEMSVEM